MKGKTLLLSFLFLFLFASSVFAALTEGLVAYYPFNGNANDASGNGNHGTVYGATLTADRFGSTNSAYSFDGVNDYIAFPETVFSPSVSGVTFSAWVLTKNIDYTGLNEIIVYKGAVNGEAALSVGNNQFGYSVKLSDSNWYYVSTPMIKNAYVHLAGVYRKGNRIEIYVNGELKGQTVIPNGDLFVAWWDYFPSSIGAYSQGRFGPAYSSYWDSVIDDVRIYNRALSEVEIQELYLDNSQLNQPPIAPTRFLPIDTETAVDSTIVTLKWLPSADPDGDAIEYCVTVKEDGTPDDIPVFMGCDNEVFISETSFTLPSTLKPGTKYWWAVWARDTLGNWSPASDWWSFTTIISQVVVPVDQPSTYTLPPAIAFTTFGKLQSYPYGSTFDPNLPTFIISHGWNFDGSITIPQWQEFMAMRIKLKTGANVLLWDWLVKATGNFPGDLLTAWLNVDDSGKNLKDAMEKIIPSNYAEGIHLIGFSLGSGVIVHASKYLYESNSNLKDNIKHLTLLDSPYLILPPGGPAFLSMLRINGVFIDNYWSLVGRFPGYLEANTNINLYNSLLSNTCDLLNYLDYYPHGYAPKWYISSINNFSDPSDLCDTTIPSYDKVRYGFYWWNNTSDVSSYYFHKPGGENWQLITPQESINWVEGQVVDTYNKLEAVVIQTKDKIVDEAKKTATKVKIIAVDTYDTVQDTLEYIPDKIEHVMWLSTAWTAGSLKLKLNSDITVTAEKDIPQDVTHMRFSFDYLLADTGGILETFINGQRIYVAYSEDYFGKGWQTSGWIDISSFAGQSVKLSFRLSNPDDTKIGEILLDDIIFAQIIPSIDSDGDSYPSDVDCNDNDPSINPGATEICDGKDNDCDGSVDEGCNVDLYIPSMSASNSANSGDTISVSDTTNKSGVSLVGASTTKIYLSTDNKYSLGDTYLGSRAVPAFGAGAQSSSGSTSVTIPTNACTQTYYLIARADADKVIPEWNKGNNNRAVAIQITNNNPSVDFYISSVTVPASANAGDTISVSDTTNKSGRCAIGASTTKIYLSTDNKYSTSDIYLGERAVGAFGAGAGNNPGSTNITIPSETPVGSYYIIMRADADKVITEWNEGNNNRAGAITIGP